MHVVLFILCGARAEFFPTRRMPMQPMYFAWFDDYYTRLACVISVFAILGGYFYLRRSRSGDGATINYASSQTALDPEVFNSPSGGFSCFLDTFFVAFFSSFNAFREISLNRTFLIVSAMTLQAAGLPTSELPALDAAPRLGVSVASCRAPAERVPVPAPAPVDRRDPAEPPAEVWMALNQPLWFLALLCFEQALKF
jgi:hypothetical protein